ncbi:MAG: tetratricopeptide repeat protein [Chloroflexi bacterium]|nr:tetratricopeptide repeat protein [Chloroflexota bacterium]
MAQSLVQKANQAKEEGLTLYRQGEYAQAAAEFAEAQRLFAAAGDRRREAEMLNNLGVVHIQLQDWEAATDFFRQAASVFETLGDVGNRGQALGNIGELYRRQGKNEEAVEALRQAAELLREAKEREKEARTWQLISRIRLGQGRWLEALHFYDLALEASEKPGLMKRLLRRFIRIPLVMMSRG